MFTRPSRTHVFIIDGTLSRLQEGHETNAGLMYKLLQQVGPMLEQSVGYHPGVQGEGLRKWMAVAAGVGINQSIQEGYAHLCSRYEPGDKIMLFGFSRGAYAVRSLAGFIDRIGLLQSRHATERRIKRAFRYYEAEDISDAARLFSQKFCRQFVPIEVVGVWDTVRALGLPYPLLSRLAPLATEFHDHRLGYGIRNAFQALALDETRTAYAPLPWQKQADWDGQLEQMWFAGAHSDIGGNVGACPDCRPLACLPLNWMLEKAETCGMILPKGWRDRFPPDPGAPMLGNRRGRALWFVLRARRIAGYCGSEFEHPSVSVRRRVLPRYRPKARWVNRPAPEENVPSRPD